MGLMKRSCHFLIFSLFVICSCLVHAQEVVDEKGKVALTQTQIKGLLVVQLDGGEFAGAASQMNATSVEKEGAFEIGFNQEVGEMMEKATVEVDKFIRVRYENKLPEGTRIEFSFADKYSPKDGPSAAVVCALMADSILSGDEIDSGFAATGDMTATGEVQPVGGVPSKIKGAIRKGCSHVAIPQQNRQSIADAYILKGIKSLYQIQVFTIESFDQAQALAMSEKPEDVQKALDEFVLIQGVLKKNEKLIFNNKVKQKLLNVVKLAPNHLSAKLLYRHSVKRGPKKLSLIGSITGIDNAGEKLSSMLDDGSFLTSGGLDGDSLTDLVYDISRLRPYLDKRTTKYADSYLKVSAFIKRYRDRKVFTDQLRRELRQLANNINIERKRLVNNEEVQSELIE